MGLLSGGTLAGVGQYAAKKREEDREDARLGLKFKTDLAMVQKRFDLTNVEAEKQRVAGVERGVNSVMASIGTKLPKAARGEIYSMIEGGRTVPNIITAYQKGELVWSQNTTNSTYSIGSVEDMSTYWEKLEGEYDLPAGFLATTAKLESSLGTNMQNPKSSAKGIFQFIDSTAKEYDVDVYDWKSSSLGAAKFAAKNRDSLMSRTGKTSVTGEELYLAHQQGAKGAANLLNSPTAMATAALSMEKVKLNISGDQTAATMTSKDFSDMYRKKYQTAFAETSKYRDTPFTTKYYQSNTESSTLDVETPTGEFGFKTVTDVDELLDTKDWYKGLTKDNYLGAAADADAAGRPDIAKKTIAHGEAYFFEFKWDKVRKENYQSMAEAQRRKGNSELADQVIAFGEKAFADEDSPDTYTQAMYAAEYKKALEISSDSKNKKWTEEDIDKANDWLANSKDIAQKVLGLDDAKNPSAKEEEIKRLVDVLGMTEEQAVKHADGLLVIRTDPVTREVMLVDKYSGTVTPILSTSLGSTSVLAPEEFIVTDPDIVEFNDGLELNPTSIDFDESLEKLESLAKSLENIDVKTAVGARGMVNAFLNNAADFLNIENLPSEDAKKASNLIKQLGVLTEVSLQAAFPDVRDSVYLKKRLRELTIDVSGPAGINTARDKTNNMVAFLRDAEKRLSDINKGIIKVNPAAKSKANVGLSQVSTLLGYYTALAGSINTKQEVITSEQVLKDGSDVSENIDGPLTLGDDDVYRLGSTD